PAAIVYGTALSSSQLNASVAAVAGGSAPGALSYAPAAGAILNAGSGQTLSVTAAATNNYNAVAKTVYIDVGQKPLTITVANKSKTYGNPNPALDGTLTGVVNGDSITATFSTAATQSSPVGMYPITATLVDGG